MHDDFRGFEWYYLWDQVNKTAYWRTDGLGIYAMDISFDGRTLAVGGENRCVELRDADNGQVLKTLPLQASHVYSVDFSDDGELIVAAGGAPNQLGEIRIWKCSTGELLKDMQQLRSAVNAVHFTPDSKHLVITSGGPQGTPGFTDVVNHTTNETKISIPASAPISFSSTVLSEDYIIVSRGEDVELWNVSTGEAKSMQSHSQSVFCLSVSPSQSIVASGGGDGLVQCWDLNANHFLCTFYGHRDDIYALTFSPDGRFLVSGSIDGEIKIWNMDSKAELLSYQPGIADIRGLFFSKDGSLLYIGANGKLLVWPFPVPVSLPQESREQIRGLSEQNVHLNVPPYIREADSMISSATSPKGTLLATSNDSGQEKIWDSITHKRLHTLEGQTVVRSLAFSHDGLTLASADDDGLIRLWQVATGEELLVLPSYSRPNEIQSVQFSSSDEQLVCTLKSGELKIWAAPRPQNRRQ
jgi:WD40 repeat protein